MTYGDPYCGGCHKWMTPLENDAGEERWQCDCLPQAPDTTKDPNCHNSNHDHHDPESPIVLQSIAIDEAERWLRLDGKICAMEKED